MTDDEIRLMLAPLAQPLGDDGSTCSVSSEQLDKALDWSEVASWVERHGGHVDHQPVIESRGMRAGQKTVRNYVPMSQRFVFPCSALEA
jgi:hypothetical protein